MKAKTEELRSARLTHLVEKWRASAIERIRTIECERAERQCAAELAALLTTEWAEPRSARLEDYVQHTAACGIHSRPNYGGPYVCTCGLAALLTAPTEGWQPLSTVPQDRRWEAIARAERYLAYEGYNDPHPETENEAVIRGLLAVLPAPPTAEGKAEVAPQQEEK